jgi:hypothetical protein
MRRAAGGGGRTYPTIEDSIELGSLSASDFHVHIPERFGGDGAEAVAGSR